jgi:antitoxin MazE
MGVNMAGTKTRIIRIGNSQGVRIPRNLLEQAGLMNSDGTTVQEVELEVGSGGILVRPAGEPRAGWAAAFERMAVEGDDTLLDDVPSATAWDEHEWVW